MHRAGTFVGVAVAGKYQVDPVFFEYIFYQFFTNSDQLGVRVRIFRSHGVGGMVEKDDNPFNLIACLRTGQIPVQLQVAEGFILAKKLGLDWQKLHEICTTATSNSFALSNYCPAPGPTPQSPANRDYAPGFMTALMLKDVKLSQAAAESTGVATPMAALAQSLYQQTADAGDAAKDFSVVFRLLEKMTR